MKIEYIRHIDPIDEELLEVGKVYTVIRPPSFKGDGCRINAVTQDPDGYYLSSTQFKVIEESVSGELNVKLEEYPNRTVKINDESVGYIEYFTNGHIQEYVYRSYTSSGSYSQEDLTQISFILEEENNKLGNLVEGTDDE